jgi:hypothetical protein
MRSMIAATSLVVLFFAAGCNLAPHHRDLGGGSGGGGMPNTATPTVDNLVKYLNENAKRIDPGQAITCTTVTIDVNADGQKVGVGGKMLCQTPRNFLLSGSVLGSPAVDIGSNNKEFWYWIRENKPPYLFHCSYDDLSRGTNIPFPFQPDMVVNALGLAQYDPAKQYGMKILDDKKGHKSIELTEQARSPQGKPIQKVTVFDFHEARPPQPQVIAHILKDEQDKIICVATVRRVQPLGPNGAIIPREIVFNWPEQKLQMTMRLENPRLIPMPPDKAATYFTRQNLRYQGFDLATQTLDGSGVQRTGATEPVYRR